MPSRKIEPADIFQCKRCGDCCRGFGGTYVSADEIRAIAAHLRMDPQEFIARHCQPSGGKLVVAQGAGGYCTFWDGACSIHPVKPRMCRLWPFIESVLIDVRNWQIMAGMCPGIRCDVPDRVVRECVRAEIKRDTEKKSSAC